MQPENSQNKVVIRSTGFQPPAHSVFCKDAPGPGGSPHSSGFSLGALAAPNSNSRWMICWGEPEEALGVNGGPKGLALGREKAALSPLGGPGEGDKGGISKSRGTWASEVLLALL